MKGKVEVELEGKSYQLEYCLYSDGDFCLISGRNGTGMDLDIDELAALHTHHSNQILLTIHKNEREKPYAEIH
jgi:hypothetical protein